MDIIELTTTAIIGSNNLNKDKVSKKLSKQFKNSIILNNNPKYNYTVREYILNYTDKINNIKFKTYKIDKLFDFSFNTLSMGEKQLVQIVTMLLSDYETIIINDALSMITNNRIFRRLKTYKNKTIIYITSNKEDIVYFKRTMLLDNKVLLHDDTIKLMEEEKSFKLISQDLPFMASLSLKLKYYDLIDKPILNMDRMVDKIWK